MLKGQINVTDKLFNYIVDNSLHEPDALKIISIEQNSIDDKILQITPHQGQFLSILIKLINPSLTLDIGTYKGYSALCVALASGNDCKTISIDNKKDYAKIAENYWGKANVSNKIEFKLGMASSVLNDLILNGFENKFDFIFIDADKANYIEYYEKSITLCKSGGVIAIDNTLYFGTVISRKIIDKYIKKWVFTDGIKAIKSLNELIKNDKRVESCLLPIADGLTLVRKK